MSADERKFAAATVGSPTSSGRAAAIASGGFFDLDVQREPDDSAGPVNFALVATLEMAGEVEVYEQVLARVGIKPQVGVRA